MKKYLLAVALLLSTITLAIAQDIAQQPTQSPTEVSAAQAAANIVAVDDQTVQVASPKKQKMDRGIRQHTFMPKGTWFAGATLSYTDISAKDYKFLLFDNLSAKSMIFSAKASGGYTFSNNVAAGVSFDYSRTLVQIDNVDMNLGSGLNFQIKEFYSIQQIYTGTAFLRTYINIGNSKRFGMFNDVRAYLGGGQGKITNGSGTDLSGTYEKILKMGLVLAPGISIFATDFMTIEATIGIFGIEYSRTEQTTNQVYQGAFETFNASFQLNLLSVGLGLAFYF